ncbi:MAG: hypothetical protein KF801_09930 [Cryobacterium sp.]|nr:hypothetical protein [Cryobacterium sp.]
MDIARDGNILYERSRSGITVRKFVSNESAAKQQARRIEDLTSKGHVAVDTKQEPATRPPKDQSSSITASIRADGWRAFHEKLPAFVAALEEAKIDPFRAFAQQGTTGRDVNAVARDCAEVAQRVFGVTYSHRLAFDHDYAGHSRAIGRASTADFFKTPARVAMIACLKLQGRLSTSDGDYDDEVAYANLDLEIAAHMRECLSARGRRP